MHPHVILAVWKQCASRPMCIFLVEQFYSYTEKTQQKKDNENIIKQNETKENYVQRTTIYNSHIGNQQINSSDTTYLLMC